MSSSSTHSHTARPDGDDRRRAPSATAALLVLVLALAACATGPGGRPERAAAEPVQYVGVFTGEYVDGIPLFRFPPIHVVGSRSGAGRDRVE